jgi:hypothetical protein
MLLRKPRSVSKVVVAELYGNELNTEYARKAAKPTISDPKTPPPAIPHGDENAPTEQCASYINDLTGEVERLCETPKFQ